MTTPDHGPGVTWLAERSGLQPEQLLRDGAALMGALEGAAKDTIDLARRLMSQDPATRTRAEAEARAVRNRFAASEGQSAEERLRERIAEALAKRPQP